jgi:signal peptidase I
LTDSDRPVAQREAVEPTAVPPGSVPPPAGGGTPAPPPATASPAKPATNWWSEIKGIIWLILAVLAFHSFVAKPFYIPSESMMPGLLKGDRLVVTKYPYGWSWVSPSFHLMPEVGGRLWGAMPEPGDIVIVTPPGGSSDYIKRVIGVPGDRIEMIAGQLFINGRAVRREHRPPANIPVDANTACEPIQVVNGRTVGQFSRDYRVRASDGQVYCRPPIIRETLPNGRSYDTIDDGESSGDDFAPVTVPPGHVWLMGDNRDHSADSRFPAEPPSNGLGGPVRWENIGGRAEFITFSLDGTSQYLNPFSWFSALRSGRAGTSLHPERAAQP